MPDSALDELRARLEIAVGSGWTKGTWHEDRGLQRESDDVRLRFFPGPNGTAYGTAKYTGGERALWAGAIVDTWGATPARAYDRAMVRLEQRLEELAERHDTDPPRLQTGASSSDLRRDAIEQELADQAAARAEELEDGVTPDDQGAML